MVEYQTGLVHSGLHTAVRRFIFFESFDHWIFRCRNHLNLYALNQIHSTDLEMKLEVLGMLVDEQCSPKFSDHRKTLHQKKPLSISSRSFLSNCDFQWLEWLESNLMKTIGSFQREIRQVKLRNRCESIASIDAETYLIRLPAAWREILSLTQRHWVIQCNYELRNMKFIHVGKSLLFGRRMLSLHRCISVMESITNCTQSRRVPSIIIAITKCTHQRRSHWEAHWGSQPETVSSRLSLESSKKKKYLLFSAY